MKRHTAQAMIIVMALSTLFLIAACSEQVVQPLDDQNSLSEFDGQVIEGQYIIVLDQGSSLGKGSSAVRSTAASLMQEIGASDESIEYVYSSSISGFSASMTTDQASMLATNDKVKRIEPDKIIALAPPPGKGPGGGGGGGGSAAQETPWGITRVGGFVDGTGKTAWILDSGIDLTHEDLNVDASRGANFTRDKSIDDLNGHGSHVSGTIAALDNSVGVVGVAAGATVVPVKVLDRRGGGSLSGVIAGIDFVAANAAPGDVANMSLGGGVSPSLDDAVVAASSNGIWFALAAGNESDDANNHSPARANGPFIVTVSAFAQGDGWASFSNFGNPPVDFAAPGVAIYSTYKGGGYAELNGTSMATPHVAGLLLATNGNLGSDGFVSGDPDGNPDPIAHL